MATATMGLRRRVHQVSSGGGSSGSGNKRTRSTENNNSLSQGNLNSMGGSGDGPAPKKTRSSSQRLAKAKELEMAKKVAPPLWNDPRPYASIAGLSIEAQQALCAEGALPSPMSYMSATMATFVGNAAAAAASLGKASPSGSGSTGAAGPGMSYLDISNMTGSRPPGWPTDELGLPPGFAAPFAPAKSTTALTSTSTTTTNTSSTSEPSSPTPAPTSTPTATQAQTVATSEQAVPKQFPNDAMFGAYQPWVIKTYGDLAKTKTITIKKYARILRTLRGEEVNSAENSKFRFWVKSKGFHIGQPEGYDAKPADRIVGRHAVTNPGLDPPLYVPTQPPHNKALNGAEGTVPPGRIYKKVAIVENFFDIIHAVHVDLEGRPGKHAGQKRTYRTITETYAFLPREAVTRFLLGCTECQRRPRTPSPTSLSVASPTPACSTPTPSSTTTSTSATTATTSAAVVALATTEKPSSPKPATTLSSNGNESQQLPQSTTTSSGSNSTASCERSKEASHPVESKSNLTAPASVVLQEQPKSPTTTITATSTVTTDSTHQPPTNTDARVAFNETATTGKNSLISNVTTNVTSSAVNKTDNSKLKNEKYNPLSITNLLRKDPIPPRQRAPIVPMQITTSIPHIPETAEAMHMTNSRSPTTTPPYQQRSSPILIEQNSHGCMSQKLRVLSEDSLRGTVRSTPSPRAPVPTRPWSPSNPATEQKYVPLDYSRSLMAAYPRQPLQPSPTTIIEAIKKESEALQQAALTRKMIKRAGSTHTSESEGEEADEVFSPAAGLIDTNLNLLATIQQLHCQVMLALTQRLRPAVSAGSPHPQNNGPPSADES